jgi:glycosyltransferase involved in cell wall biosynthesis
LWDKGVAEYVEAARTLKGQTLPIELLIAGAPDAGNPTSVPAALVREWHEAGLITHLGHVDDMAALLSDIDIVVLPSYREGAPRSLIEAAAAGVPVITTDVPGCREVVEHGVNGIIVPAREVRALAAAIRFLHEHPNERIRMGAAGREKALRQFDQRLVFEATHALYLELFSQTSPRRNHSVLQAR